MAVRPEKLLYEYSFKVKKEFQSICLESVTVPEAAIYFILDFKNITYKDFTTSKFVDYCASDGKVKLEGKVLYCTFGTNEWLLHKKIFRRDTGKIGNG